VNGDYSTNNYFDQGNYSFQSNDMDNYPPGNYHFTFTITIGNSKADVLFTMTLTNPCPS